MDHYSTAAANRIDRSLTQAAPGQRPSHGAAPPAFAEQMLAETSKAEALLGHRQTAPLAAEGGRLKKQTTTAKPEPESKQTANCLSLEQNTATEPNLQ